MNYLKKIGVTVRNFEEASNYMILLSVFAPLLELPYNSECPSDNEINIILIANIHCNTYQFSLTYQREADLVEFYGISSFDDEIVMNVYMKS